MTETKHTEPHTENPHKGRSRPTVVDIAKHAGVSIATVSRVLNGQPRIARETRERVLNALHQVGYEPRILQKLGYELHNGAVEPTQEPLLIGLSCVTMDHGAYTDILSGAVEALHAYNARPVICPIPRRHNCNMNLLERFMDHSTVGGLIIGSTEKDEEVKEGLQQGYPYVIIYPDHQVSEGIPVVASANWNGSKIATEYLIGLGHTDIGVLKYSHDLFTHNYIVQERFAGYQSAMLTAGLTIEPHFVFECESPDRTDGYKAGKALLSLPHPPTAIVANSDTLAVGVLQAAQEMGVRVPQDLSLIGFDDTQHARASIPALTTIRQPFEEMGRVGVDMLFRLLDGRPLDVSRVELAARLLIRESTAPVRDRVNS